MEATASAEQMLAQGRFEDAHRASLEILAREPSNVKALLVRAAACVSLRRLDEAEGAARAALVASPRDSSARYVLANVALLAGPPERALAAFANALANGHGASDESDPWRVLRLLVDAYALRTPAAQWQASHGLFDRFGGMLARVQPQASAEALREIAASPILATGPHEFAGALRAISRLLGFGSLASPEWNRCVVEGVLVPWMRRALAEGRYGIALILEQAIYRDYVKQTESEAHFRDSFALWKDDMRAAGARYAAALPPAQRGAKGKLPRVAFFLHNLSLLAHAMVVLETLEGHALLEAPIVEATVFFHNSEPQAVECFRGAGVRLVSLTPPGAPMAMLDALVRLRERIAAEGIETLVWVTSPLAMPFAFGMRLAPRQVWWAMKYHALEFPEIDGYVTGGSQIGGTKTIHGREWRVGPVAAQRWFAPERAAEAARVRAALGARIVYGSFGREEKLNSAAFLDAVVEILQRVPDAAFLWTGRQQHPAIQARLDAAGVAARCHFIGWVDTKLYAQVIDVFLDSFPFPCGFTLYEAMAAGKPVVLFDSPESTNGGINALVAPLLAAPADSSEAAATTHRVFRPEPGVDLYLRTELAADYVEAAVRLASDADWRARVGAAGRAFVEQLMANRKSSARIYLDHLLGR